MCSVPEHKRCISIDKYEGVYIIVFSIAFDFLRKSAVQQVRSQKTQIFLPIFYLFSIIIVVFV